MNFEIVSSAWIYELFRAEYQIYLQDLKIFRKHKHPLNLVFITVYEGVHIYFPLKSSLNGTDTVYDFTIRDITLSHNMFLGYNVRYDYVYMYLIT